jgi:hypothetical protein
VCPICARNTKREAAPEHGSRPGTVDVKASVAAKSYALLGVFVVVVGLFAGTISYVMARPILGAECLASALTCVLGLFMVASLPLSLFLKMKKPGKR